MSITETQPSKRNTRLPDTQPNVLTQSLQDTKETDLLAFAKDSEPRNRVDIPANAQFLLRTTKGSGELVVLFSTNFQDNKAPLHALPVDLLRRAARMSDWNHGLHFTHDGAEYHIPLNFTRSMRLLFMLFGDQPVNWLDAFIKSRMPRALGNRQRLVDVSTEEVDLGKVLKELEDLAGITAGDSAMGEGGAEVEDPWDAIFRDIFADEPDQSSPRVDDQGKRLLGGVSEEQLHKELAEAEVTSSAVETQPRSALTTSNLDSGVAGSHREPAEHKRIDASVPQVFLGNPKDFAIRVGKQLLERDATPGGVTPHEHLWPETIIRLQALSDFPDAIAEDQLQWNAIAAQLPGFLTRHNIQILSGHRTGRGLSSNFASSPLCAEVTQCIDALYVSELNAPKPSPEMQSLVTEPSRATDRTMVYWLLLLFKDETTARKFLTISSEQAARYCKSEKIEQKLETYLSENAIDVKTNAQQSEQVLKMYFELRKAFPNWGYVIETNAASNLPRKADSLFAPASAISSSLLQYSKQNGSIEHMQLSPVSFDAPALWYMLHHLDECMPKSPLTNGIYEVLGDKLGPNEEMTFQQLFDELITFNNPEPAVVETEPAYDWLKGREGRISSVDELTFLNLHHINDLDFCFFEQLANKQTSRERLMNYKDYLIAQTQTLAQQHGFLLTRRKKDFIQSQYGRKLLSELKQGTESAWEDISTFPVLSELAHPDSIDLANLVILLVYRLVSASTANELIHAISRAVDTYLRSSTPSLGVNELLGSDVVAQQLYLLVRADFPYVTYTIESHANTSAMKKQKSPYLEFPTGTFRDNRFGGGTYDEQTSRLLNALLLRDPHTSMEHKKLMYALVHHTDRVNPINYHPTIVEKFKITDATTFGDILRILHKEMNEVVAN